MQQKTRLHDSFFGMKGPEPRPSSIATEIVDTEWDEDDIISDIEDDDDANSPRVSLQSVRAPTRACDTSPMPSTYTDNSLASRA